MKMWGCMKIFKINNSVPQEMCQTKSAADL